MEPEMIKASCRCGYPIPMDRIEYERRLDKYGPAYRPWCGPCTAKEDAKYRTYHSD